VRKGVKRVGYAECYEKGGLPMEKTQLKEGTAGKRKTVKVLYGAARESTGEGMILEGRGTGREK